MFVTITNIPLLPISHTQEKVIHYSYPSSRTQNVRRGRGEEGGGYIRRTEVLFPKLHGKNHIS